MIDKTILTGMIQFVNYDGTVLQTSYIEYGTTPTYTGETPTKEATAQYTYTFSGWTPAITVVTGDAAYTATYTATAIETEGTEGLIYTLSNDGTYYSVTGYNGTATEVVIPNRYEGKSVTSIGDSAFYGCSGLTSVTIPDRETCPWGIEKINQNKIYY